MDPIVVLIEEEIPKTKCKDFIGESISERIKQLLGKDIDAVVKIAFKRREYKGKQKRDSFHIQFFLGKRKHCVTFTRLPE